MDNNQSIYGDILTPDAKKKAVQDIYSSWEIENDLCRQVDRATNGLERLMRAIDRSMISADISDQKKFIEEYKKAFDKIAYLTDEFVKEFKPKYEQMTDLYVTEKVAGTFDPKEDQYGLCTDSAVGYSPMSSDEDKNSW